MKKQTDINSVKAIAKRLLYTEVHLTDYSPMIVQHPFTNTGIVMIRETNQFLDTTVNTENLQRWQSFISVACGYYRQRKRNNSGSCMSSTK